MEPSASGDRARALRRVLLRQKLRLWASKSAQERDALAENIGQLFSSTTASAAAASSAVSLAQRPITRRPGVEEVKQTMLSSVYACLPPSCSVLRGEIWQVLLNVYKRNQHGSSAQEFDRMILRLSKLPRDPVMVEECAHVSALLAADGEEDRERVQRDLEVLLTWFLTTKSVAYSSGMAHIVAPFFLLGMALPTIYDCFYQYCANFLPHIINNEIVYETSSSSITDTGSDMDTSSFDGDAEALATSAREAEQAEKRLARQQLVEQLVSYHVPQLAHYLNQWCPKEWSDPGELIPSNFFLEDLYQAIPPRSFLYVIDQYLLTGDTMFGLFLLVATLVQQQEALMACTSAEAVRSTIRSSFASAFESEENAQFLCMSAARLRRMTPRSYKCSLRDASPDVRCPSRLATELAFGQTTGPASSTRGSSITEKTSEVDMSQWQKKESRSIAGKIFWYHASSGKTQWEHPAEKIDPPPASFSLPISIEEVGNQIMGEKSVANGLRFFVVDCRGLRSSNDLKSGRIPAAYTLDPSVFDSPDLIAKSMEALDPMKSCVHVVLVGDGVGIPPELLTTEEIKTSVRDAVRLDTDAINRATLFFQKRGFPFVSCLDGGYSSWHSFMRDNAACSPSELLNHVESECHYCRYDTILRTGEDPLKKAAQQTKSRRKKSAMPTTTTLQVNGGEGDSSIVSTDDDTVNPVRNSLIMSAMPTSRRTLGLSRNSMPSINNMRSKLSEVKMPKLQWSRGRFGSRSNSNQQDSGSSSETATVEEGGSDRGSSATEESEDKAGIGSVDEQQASSDSTAAAKAASPKERKKSFVGVFTIDYSDDEEEEDLGHLAESPAALTASMASSSLLATQSA